MAKQHLMASKEWGISKSLNLRLNIHAWHKDADVPDMEREKWPRKSALLRGRHGEKHIVEGLQRTWREAENTNGMASQALHCLTVMTAAPLQALMKMTSNFLLTVLIVFSSLLNEFGWCLVCPQHLGLGMLWGLLNVKTPEWLSLHVLTQWTNADNSLYAHVHDHRKYVDTFV